MLDLTSTYEAKINSANLAAIDMIEVDFGGGVKRYWSTKELSSAYLSDMTNPPMSNVEARLLTIGERKWVSGFSNDSVTLTLGDADGQIRYIFRQDPKRFEGAKVSLHRLVHTSAGKEVYENYWSGRGLAPELKEDQVEWEIEFGLGHLQQRFGRRIQLNCSAIFGDQLLCPYSLSKGRGLPNTKVTGTATGGGYSTMQDSSASFTTEVVVGWWVWMQSTNAYAKIISIDSDTQLTLDMQVAGENGRTYYASGQYHIGPPFSFCSKNVPACKDRGMFGQHNQTTFNINIGDNRRYYLGNAESADVSYQGKVPSGDNKGDRFNRSAMGNSSMDGNVIPVIIGDFRIRNVQSLYHAPAGAFQHGIFIISEGEIYDLYSNLGDMEINGYPKDNHTNPGPDTPANNVYVESFMHWGTWKPNGLEDHLIKDLESARRVRTATGRRKSACDLLFGRTVDAYGTGVYKRGNPYLFNNMYGDGMSLSGLAMARVRIETGEDDLKSLSGEFRVSGLVCPIPPGGTNNTDDTNPNINVTVNGQTYRYTYKPNPIQVAYAFLTNPRWGAGLTDAALDLQSFIDESDFCEESISGVTGSNARIAGVVKYGPSDTWLENPNPEKRNFIFTEDITTIKDTLIGRQLNITESGKEQSRWIRSNILFTRPSVDDAGQAVDNPRLGDDNFDTEVIGTMLIVTEPWEEGKIPAATDTFEITGIGTQKRYRANGALADEISVGEMLERILANCNGSFRQSSEGKLEVFIRKEEDLDTVLANGIFTDRGVNRNIIRDKNGISSMKVWRERDGEVPNEYSCDFFDKEKSHRESRMVVFSEDAQKRTAALFNETGDRKKITSNVELNLTTNKDQAARLLALQYRERMLQNLYCSFSTSLKQGMPVEVGDVIAVESALFPAYKDPITQDTDATPGEDVLYWRVLEKTENDKYVLTFTCQVHVNQLYDDSAVDFGDIFGGDGPLQPKDGLPLDVTPSTPTETVIEESGGKLSSQINVEVTYPSEV